LSRGLIAGALLIVLWGPFKIFARAASSRRALIWRELRLRLDLHFVRCRGWWGRQLPSRYGWTFERKRHKVSSAIQWSLDGPLQSDQGPTPGKLFSLLSALCFINPASRPARAQRRYESVTDVL